ncbi:hypothetical protein CRYUN_Cryun40dG0089200 [Craigia yunnanensis]
MGRARNQRNTNPSKTKHHQTSPASTTTQPSKIKQPHHFYPRKSYYFTRELIPSDRFYASPANTKSTDAHFPDPTRKSSKQRSRKRNIRSSPKLATSSVSASCSCRATHWTKADSPPEYSASSSSDSSSDQKLCESFLQEFGSDCILTTESFDNMVSWSRSCSCKVMNSKANDIVIDTDNKPVVKKFEKLDEFDKFSELELPPIVTKPAKFNDMVKDIKKKENNNESTKCRRSSAKFEGKNAHGSLSVKVVKEERITVKENKNTSPVRKISVNSPGVRLRINSPKIASRRIQAHARKSVSSNSSSSSRRSLSDSFAVVKSSFDPQRDFRDSMLEMIMENNIRASKDLEDLLACYLSLNSDEYHDLIIKVFKQIWFDLSDFRLK